MFKLESLVVLAVDFGLPKTHLSSSEPTTHRNKDHMVMPWWFIRTNCTIRTNATLLASQVGRYDVLACGDL